ncbi:facilitated trehalose transporter Tret1-like [Episyrphus balteatus]|uniref:facilitated trehalose transporter Tret1-like n=1 Tax=Episyrphus balteatus TaxID=286459 RepID=UPI0024861CA7|nr:facilitated trehalose transporter Tret1-like [Episyrphus balteatus]
MFHMNSNNPDSVFYKNYRLQLAATLTVNILTFSHGIGLGWSAPMLLIFQTPESPLEFKISVEETSWIGACVGVGAIFGNFIFGILLDLIGRKKCLYLLGVPHIFFWVLIMFANDVYYLYIARILGGISGGGLFGILPIFVAEIADLKVRGTLGAIFCFSLNVGMLFGNIIATLVPYVIIPCVILVLPISYLIFVMQFPETPQFLLRQNQIDAASKSLKYYSNIKEKNKDALQQFEINFNEMKELILSSKNKERLSLKDICSKRFMKALLMGLALVIIYSFTGIWPILNYSSLIFAEAHSSMDPKTNTIIIGVFQIIGSYCAFVLIDKFGRKFLLLVSSIGMFLGFGLFGVHSYMATNLALNVARWLPVVLMAFIILAANIGVISVTFIVLVEIIPPKIRSFVTALVLVSASIMYSVALKLFPVLMYLVGLSGVMWICASFAAFGFIFYLIFLKETKGMNLNDEDTYN